MKTVKIILLLAIVSLFTSMTYNTTEARDCSNPKGFHAKMMCTLAGEGSSNTSGNSEKKKGDGFWKKIKNFGGKNIGEAG